MSEYWEPWKPSIGQRVRVRLSEECRYCLESLADEENAIPPDDVRLIDGATGTIRSTPHYLIEESGHRYYVWFDVPVRMPRARGTCTGSMQAAIELELLDAVPSEVPA